MDMQPQPVCNQWKTWHLRMAWIPEENSIYEHQLYTINALISAKLIEACIIFQLAEVVDMFTRTGDNSFWAIAYQVGQQQQWLHSQNDTIHTPAKSVIV